MERRKEGMREEKFDEKFLEVEKKEEWSNGEMWTGLTWEEEKVEQN